MSSKAVAGAYILGCAGPELSASEVAFFRAADPWGFILFQRNCETKAQVRRLTSALREAVGRDAPVLIDQEGGRVQRLWPPVWASHPPALDLAEASPDPERALWLRGALIAAELREIGIDVNCAPMADTAFAGTHPRLRNRCYGQTAPEVARRARALAEGQVAGGVLGVLKHIPGHGSATKDSHIDLPRVTKSAEILAREDFAPFKALADLPLGMTAHVVFEAHDAERPATTSPAMHRIIREEIGFDGLLMTDDLSMEALAGSVRTRAEAALSAGCDVILHCNGDMAEMEEVVTVGAMTEAAAARAARALAARTAPAHIDTDALTAELRSLTNGAAA
ncbi:MAG: beta-N-acetylhexosaminidase [Pseudomonadota bacterium]